MTGPDTARMPSTMRLETAEAPEAVARQLTANRAAVQELANRLRSRPPRFVATGARGSSDNAAVYAKHLLETRLGLCVASIAPSVSSVYAGSLRLEDALFVAISQSGRGPDLLSLVETARRGGAVTLAFVNDAASPLAAACDVCLPLHAGVERSVTATKTFITSLSAAAHFVAAWAGDTELASAVERLPDDLGRARGCGWDLAMPVLEGGGDLYVLGRGPGLAVAQEAALKLKETCRMHAEAYSAAEVMHGPLALAESGFPVMIFGQDDAALASLDAAATRLAGLGARVLAAGPVSGQGVTALPTVAGMHPALAAITQIQSFYPLAERLARAHGLDPDNPPNLRKVTETL